MKKIIQLAAVAALCLTAVAQTPVARMANAVTVATEGNYVMSVSIPNAVFQWGAGGSGWCPTLVTSLKAPIYVTNTAALCTFDPAPNVIKSLAVQQGTSAFSVIVVANGKATAIPIPALPPPAPTSRTYKFSCTFPAPTTSPMPSTVTITCGPAVLQ